MAKNYQQSPKFQEMKLAKRTKNSLKWPHTVPMANFCRPAVPSPPPVQRPHPKNIGCLATPPRLETNISGQGAGAKSQENLDVAGTSEAGFFW